MIDLTLSAGDQDELECAVLDELRIRQVNTKYADAAQWGEWRVLQGKVLHAVQWSYVGEEVYDDDGNVIGMDFPDGIDCQIDCSWIEEENYENS